MNENGSNDNKKRARPEIPPEVKAEMDESAASVNRFMQYLSVFLMHQVAFANEIAMDISIKDKKIDGFDFQVDGDFKFEPPEEKKDG